MGVSFVEMQGAAHPRSRGENGADHRPGSPTTGSSPLTRGKRIADTCRKGDQGLIPAHAGKTYTQPERKHEDAAHPRSRGENAWKPRGVAVSYGSSPLTRGKLDDDVRHGEKPRLIPAHAGKTLTICSWPASRQAHPRSRGENDRRGALTCG